MKIKRLEHKVILYVPLAYGSGEGISDAVSDELLSKSLDRLIDLGGGATVLDGSGYWKKNNEVNWMPTKVIIVYVDDVNEARRVLEEVALLIKKETLSDTICYEIDGILYFI